MPSIPTELDSKLIAQLHPVMQEKVTYVLVKANGQSLFCGLHSGLRTFEKQHGLWLLGRDEQGNVIDQSKIVTLADAGDSIHNYGLAGDIVMLVNGNWSWDYKKLPYDKLAEIAREVNLVCGYDFKKIPDPPHYQYTGGLSTKEIKELYAKGGMPAVWKSVV